MAIPGSLSSVVGMTIDVEALEQSVSVLEELPVLAAWLVREHNR
jgi:hypothetical protein